MDKTEQDLKNMKTITKIDNKETKEEDDKKSHYVDLAKKIAADNAGRYPYLGYRVHWIYDQ